MKKLNNTCQTPRKGGCLRYGATVFCTVGAVIYLAMGVTGSNLIDENIRPAMFILAALMVFFIWLMWKPRKQNSSSCPSHCSPIEEKRIDTAIIPVIISSGKAKNALTGEPLSRPEVKKLHSYALINVKRHQEILQDCMDLIETTNTIDVYFFRYDLLVKTLEECALYRILFHDYPYNPDETLRKAYQSRSASTMLFIRRSHEYMKQKALSLKTEKGRTNRYIKYYNELIPNLDASDREVMDYIIRLKTADGIINS